MQNSKNLKRSSISKKSSLNSNKSSKSKTTKTSKITKTSKTTKSNKSDIQTEDDSDNPIKYLKTIDIPSKTKYEAVMLLHALGDTIGFKNGDWEFNYKDPEKLNSIDYVNELIYEFIDLGGVNGIDLSDWKVSDDTFLHIAVGNALLEYDEVRGIEPLIDHTKKYLIHEASRMNQEVKGTYVDKLSGKKIKFNRYIGITTNNSINQFTRKHDARYTPFDEEGGGNGAAMRTPVIGLCFGKNDDSETLVRYSIQSSMITHNNPLGYLAGFTVALFVVFGMIGMQVESWPYALLYELNDPFIKTILPLEDQDQSYNFVLYIKYWQKYIDTRFGPDNMPIKTRSHSNPMHRIRYFYDNFHHDTTSRQIGASGFLCAIMAYDALLDCSGYWEKLIVYSMLHSGDSDTIGAVAGALYGSVYGFGDVPPKMLEHIERKEELEELATKLYDKFDRDTDG
jgi:ADP-ribosylarginine hydrolase